jgi:hypothetical protein
MIYNRFGSFSGNNDVGYGNRGNLFDSEQYKTEKETTEFKEVYQHLRREHDYNLNRINEKGSSITGIVAPSVETLIQDDRVLSSSSIPGVSGVGSLSTSELFAKKSEVNKTYENASTSSHIYQSLEERDNNNIIQKGAHIDMYDNGQDLKPESSNEELKIDTPDASYNDTKFRPSQRLNIYQRLNIGA